VYFKSYRLIFLSMIFLGSLMHSITGNLQSARTVSPSLANPPTLIDFVFSSSKGDPTFSNSFSFVIDFSLASLPEVGLALSCDSHVLPDSGSEFPGNQCALSRIGFPLSCSRSEFYSIGFPLLLNAYLFSTKLTDVTQKTPCVIM
jgi:hypothetical protein